MQFPAKTCILAATVLLAGTGMATAQQAAQQDPQQPDPAQMSVTAPAPGGASEGATPSGTLVLLFDTASAALDARNEAILDKASRLYREGKPIIMIVSGSTDTTGSPARNLIFSQERADAVARGLLARGIPAMRTQILAKGVTNLPVPTPPGVAEAQNKRVEITWR